MHELLVYINQELPPLLKGVIADLCHSGIVVRGVTSSTLDNGMNSIRGREKGERRKEKGERRERIVQ